MSNLRTAEEIEIMRRGGQILARVLHEITSMIKPGMHTCELDQIAEAYIVARGAKPAFKGYRGYPSALCVSVNEEVVHGIPGNRVLKEGDLVSLDLGVFLEGFYTDAAVTVPVGRVTPTLLKLLRVCRDALAVGIEKARPGLHLGDISAAIQKEVERNGLYVVRDFAGHGIGKQLHEEPQVANFGQAGTGILLEEGMTLAIEPMVNLGTSLVSIQGDGWTVVTRDQRPSAHFEHTVAITANGPEILTE